jgi:hypothetical protein
MKFIGKNIHILLSVLVMVVTLQLSKMVIPSSPSASAAAPVDIINESPFEKTATAARYSESAHSWTLSAKVLQVKDVSIYGRPGSIAKIEYINNGKPKQAWAAIKIEDYYFTDSTSALIEGDKITLQVSGKYVSSKGVDWKDCPKNDLYCQNASFIEGGFPTSEDFNGLTISPSNMLIYWGSVEGGAWVNGVLAWKILTNSVVKPPP